MRMYGDLASQDDSDAESLVDHSADWLDPEQDGLADSPELDLGDGGFPRPWKTTDI